MDTVIITDRCSSCRWRCAIDPVRLKSLSVGISMQPADRFCGLRQPYAHTHTCSGHPFSFISQPQASMPQMRSHPQVTPGSSLPPLRRRQLSSFASCRVRCAEEIVQELYDTKHRRCMERLNGRITAFTPTCLTSISNRRRCVEVFWSETFDV
jgi:hypothetical protein